MKTKSQERKHKLEIARQKAKAWSLKQKIQKKERKYQAEQKEKLSEKTRNTIQTKSLPQAIKSNHTSFNSAHISTLKRTLSELESQKDSITKTIRILKERLQEVAKEDSEDKPL